MAHILELTDGSTTVDFLDECGTSPWCHLEDGGLELKPPPKKQTWSGSNVWRQGRTLAKHSYENREIVIRFEIGGSSWDDILDMRGTIYRLLEQTRDYQLRGFDNSVSLKYQVDTTSGAVWFDVLDGELVLPKDLMSVEKLGWTKCGGDDVLKDCQLKLTCKPFARGTQVTLVSGTTIQNADDSSRNNYVTWSGSSVDGDVPGPLKIALQRNYSDSTRYNEYWLGLRDQGTPADMINVLEAEDADSIYGSPSPSGPNNVYSGTYTVVFSSLPADTDITLLKWDIPSTTAALSRAGRFRVLAVGSFAVGSTLLRMSYEYLVSPIMDYPWHTVGSAASEDVVDLGVIEWPPWDVHMDQGYGDFTIMLKARLPSSGNVTIDALYLLPADDYKFRHWKWRGYSQLNTHYVYDRGRRDQVSRYDTTPVGMLDWWGLPLHATPGEDGRLFFLIKNWVGGYDARYASDITVYHTPYYLDVRGAS